MGDWFDMGDKRHWVSDDETLTIMRGLAENNRELHRLLDEEIEARQKEIARQSFLSQKPGETEYYLLDGIIDMVTNGLKMLAARGVIAEQEPVRYREDIKRSLWDMQNRGRRVDNGNR